eukprot:NODE_16685_length_983_cov_3.239486.p4 GENE.NODE_16685_length_983_cov_3.239486~~NODE_16685_length_983_cov_3.239486.p4  ORF type:complete len:63 (-),score=26.01 NODE_16685_length_983_cov_3.239486:206-394(-)
MELRVAVLRKKIEAEEEEKANHESDDDDDDIVICWIKKRLDEVIEKYDLYDDASSMATEIAG